ncbi:MAG: tRNA uridine-5-carboxymethylaminomethyl(34) synthesis GTPase MnmE [Rickettsiales bacterium]|nr:tRNA uridine-5-carboxymethylaminomethyl(34) synthesis GTPase MnmE [Rickettsiales bacterium]
MSTIFAPITSEIPSAVSVIRISGPDATQLLDVFSLGQKVKPRFAYYSDFIYEGQLIDNGLFIYFKGPYSFTGEDVIEFNLHGSPAILKEFLKILSSLDGFSFAAPGEFSKRAFLNGKMDLLQAEAVNDLVKAGTRLQSDQALKQLKGNVSVIYNTWRDNLINMLAILEAYIDFPDDDIELEIVDQITIKLNDMNAAISEFLNDNKAGCKISNGIKIALIGKTNAGKSSLLNELAGRDVAIVSDIAGTTRDVIDVELDLGGLAVILSDTAGIRESQDVIENIGIKKAIFTAQNADLRILLLDGGAILSEDDLTNENVKEGDLIIVNKEDILNKSNQDLIAKYKLNTVSTKTKSGINELINLIQERIKSEFNWGKGYAISKERHINEIENIVKYLNRFDLTNDLILACENLRLAANCLSRITGKIDIEDILDKIFKEFCIGK